MLRARYKRYGRTQEAQLRFRAIRDVGRGGLLEDPGIQARICEHGFLA
jgi:hypothetical protein